MSAENDSVILFLDIENTPNTAYVWDKYQQDVIKYVKEWNLLSIAWKFKGEKKVSFAGLPDFVNFEKDRDDDSALVGFIWELLDMADIVVAHNGKDFDVRKINARFAKFGMTPPSPYRVVDTKVIAKKVFKFNSNSLKDLANYMGLDAKMETGGFDLWEKCMAGDPKAWKKMEKYNRQDVVVLEELYERLLPWDSYHPNITLGSGIGYRCPKCGSTFVESRGWRNLKSWRARQYRCMKEKGGCGAWSTGAREKLPFQVLN